MPDSRELTFGLDFGLDKTIADLEKVKDNLEDIKTMQNKQKMPLLILEPLSGRL